MARHPPIGPPEGLLYLPAFLAPADQARLWAEVERVEYRAFEMRGQVAKRTVAFFGYDYGYDRSQLVPGPPLPEFLLELKARLEQAAGLPPGKFVQALINRYPEGAGIGWHQDAPQFGSVVAGVSLGAPARLRLRPTRRKAGVHEVRLEPGSAYVLSGKARQSWQHMLPPVDGLRYSITFRSVRSGFLREHEPAQEMGTG